MTLRPCLESRTLKIKMQHEHHEPYDDKALSKEVMAVVSSKIATQTPAEIFRSINDGRVPGHEKVTQNQIYYQWQKANSAKWRRHKDATESARLLLAESENHFEEYAYGGCRGLALFIKETTKILATEVVELCMDATYGTNNEGMELYAVLAEVDGTGIPIAYMFVDKTVNNANPASNLPGGVTYLLQQFLATLRNLGFRPRFVGTDKDRSEINAIQTVWPSAFVQLCFWHVKRAIMEKLKSSAKTKTLQSYRPEEAAKIVPDLELCWGATMTRRPHGEHRSRQCSCSCKDENFSELGRCETGTVQERETVLTMVAQHFNTHPLITDKRGTRKTSTQIWRQSASEMYQWCRSRNYYHLWAYLFVHWYSDGQWQLWARSSNPAEIPILKTTMIVESHWRKLKHDYLHRFNRPRIDLIVYMLLERVIPDSIRRLAALRRGCRRQGVASWRKDFKRIHLDLLERPQNGDITTYHTNPVDWTCGCDAFLDSRFLICKHIVQCFEKIEQPAAFYRLIRRQRAPPFWTHSALVLKPEFRLPQAPSIPSSNEEVTNDEDEEEEAEEVESIMERDSTSGMDSDNDAEIAREVQSTTDVNTGLQQLDAVKEDFLFLLETVREEYLKGNISCYERYMKSQSSTMSLAKDVKQRKAQRTMPRTWGASRHPAAMYFS